MQSWLASVFYGAADKWWGPAGVLLVVAAVATSVAALVWTLTRPAHSLISRVLIVGPLLIIGADGGWVERPLLFGLLSLCLVLLAAEGRLDPRWLVPTMWLWVNTHGSFPLGLVAVGSTGHRPSPRSRVGHDRGPRPEVGRGRARCWGR